MKQMKTCLSAAFVLATLAGSAMGQVAVDGKKGAGEPYVQLFVQNVPTSAGDNFPQVASGVDQVSTGVEFAIPLAALGNPTGAIKVTGWVNGGGHNFLSNQVIGTLPANSSNLGEPRGRDFQAAPFNAFNVFATITPVTVADGSVVVDGTRDAGYGTTAGFAQTNYTGFGNANAGNVGGTNGSEIDNVYLAKDSTNLYVFIGGNLESNFNKLDLFFDTQAGGQNALRGDNPDVDFNGLNRMGDNGGGNGLRFSADFEADYYVTVGGNGSSLFVNYAALASADGSIPGTGGYVGQGTYGGPDGTLTGGGSPTLKCSINNSNKLGVTGSAGSIPSVDNAVGSEIDNVQAYIDGSNQLHLLVAGNLETSFQKLDLFFDVGRGGQNKLRGDNVDIDFGGLNRMGDDGTGNGVKFDPDFKADYWVAVTNGGSPVQQYSNAAVLRADGKLRDFGGNSYDYGTYSGGDKATNNPGSFDGPQLDIYDGITPNLFAQYAPRHLVSLDPVPGLSIPTPGLIKWNIDNSNTAGVNSDNVGNPGAVNTGIELLIDLRELGWDGTGCLKLAGFINSGGHDFVANQVIGGLPGNGGAIGEPRTIDFSTTPGNQYVVLAGTCPPPACRLDYNVDGSINPDDIGDFITDYFTAPPIAGPGGYAIPCPGNPPPYDQGYKAAYTSDGNGQCGEPNPDNLGDWITDYFIGCPA